MCLAALAGVPFVALPSNTWKAEGLLEVLPGGQQLCRSLDDLPGACEAAVRRAETFAEIRRFVELQRPLQTFAGLVRV